MMQEAYLEIIIPIAGADYDTTVALLSEQGYYAFEEDPAALKAYIHPQDFHEIQLQDTLAQLFPGKSVAYSQNLIPATDWNAEWEKNFHSVEVGHFCEVHPPHRQPSPGFAHHVLVAPKMAFGTGHHATTWLMIDQCQELNFDGKSVLDMGCGTGVLGILAHKLGAKSVSLIDYDPWSVENTLENASLNAIEGLEVLLGDASAIPAKCYDILLANINRNVLMADRDRYFEVLAPGGQLLLSGFYDFDESKLKQHYQAAGLEYMTRKEKDQWVMLAFRKPVNGEGEA